jgi:hypothetical protein
MAGLLFEMPVLVPGGIFLISWIGSVRSGSLLLHGLSPLFWPSLIFIITGRRPLVNDLPLPPRRPLIRNRLNPNLNLGTQSFFYSCLRVICSSFEIGDGKVRHSFESLQDSVSTGLFALLGWDPTRQRRMPARIKRIWGIAVALAATSLFWLATWL